MILFSSLEAVSGQSHAFSLLSGGLPHGTENIEVNNVMKNFFTKLFNKSKGDRGSTEVNQTELENYRGYRGENHFLDIVGNPYEKSEISYALAINHFEKREISYESPN